MQGRRPAGRCGLMQESKDIQLYPRDYGWKQLWFDVGIKRYKTGDGVLCEYEGCGLMQESKDIQRTLNFALLDMVVV